MCQLTDNDRAHSRDDPRFLDSLRSLGMTRPPLREGFPDLAYEFLNSFVEEPRNSE